MTAPEFAEVAAAVRGISPAAMADFDPTDRELDTMRTSSAHPTVTSTLMRRAETDGAMS